MGYHIREIKRHTYGTFGKVREEFEEAQDANGQGNPLMVLQELSDLYGALLGFCQANYMAPPAVWHTTGEEASELGPVGFPMVELAFSLLADKAEGVAVYGAHMMPRFQQNTKEFLQEMEAFLRMVELYTLAYNIRLRDLAIMASATARAFRDGTRAGTVSEMHMVHVRNPGELLGPQLVSYSPATGWKYPEGMDKGAAEQSLKEKTMGTYRANDNNDEELADATGTDLRAAAEASTAVLAKRAIKWAEVFAFFSPEALFEMVKHLPFPGEDCE